MKNETTSTKTIVYNMITRTFAKYPYIWNLSIAQRAIRCMFKCDNLSSKKNVFAMSENVVGLKIVCSLVALFIFSSAFAQNWRSGWVYIENVQTGLVIDVQGNVKANGTNVWPYSLNHSKAQMFQFSEFQIADKYGDEARRIMAYDNGSLGSDFYLSVKTPAMVIAPTSPGEPETPDAIKPDLVLPAMKLATDSPRSNKKTLRNFVFTIESKRELDDSPSSIISASELTIGSAPKQIWKILPVPNEDGVYYIQNAQFREKMVMEPLDFSSGGTLVLSSFTGSNLQKWRIIKTTPPEATDLKLSNLEWEEIYDQSPWYKPWKWHYDYKIKGKLSWKVSDVSNVVKQDIRVSDGDGNRESMTLAANISSTDFNFKSSSSAKSQEHCFDIKTYSKWKGQNWAFSDDECKKPTFEESPPPKTDPAPGVGKLIISNCHNDKKSVRLWTYDLTTNNGAWKDHGTIGSQWQGSGCPSGPPKEITLEDDHVYLLVAIDCGELPPNQTQGICHKLTSSQIQGGKDGASLTFQVN